MYQLGFYDGEVSSPKYLIVYIKFLQFLFVKSAFSGCSIPFCNLIGIDHPRNDLTDEKYFFGPQR